MSDGKATITVGVSYATPQRQLWMTVQVPEGSTVRDAIEASLILDEFPEIDLDAQKVGVFGKLAKLDQKLADEDRVEIYRPITADPKAVKRKRADTTEADADAGG